MAYVVTFLAFIFIYIFVTLLNPIATCAMQQVALLKYKDGSDIKYRFIYSKKRILRELIYENNLDFLKNNIKKYECVYMYDRNYILKSYDGNNIKNVSENKKYELINNLKSNFFDIFWFYSINRYVSFIKENVKDENIT